MIDLNRALQEKRPDYRRKQHKVIFLHDNAPSHTAKRVKETIETLSWEILAHAAYSPDLAPCDYHLFASLVHALAEVGPIVSQHCTNVGNQQSISYIGPTFNRSSQSAECHDKSEFSIFRKLLEIFEAFFF